MIDIRRSAFMETIDMLINEIESEVLKAKKAAFSNSDIVINKAVLLRPYIKIQSKLSARSSRGDSNQKRARRYH